MCGYGATYSLPILLRHHYVDQVICANHGLEEVCQLIDADSLAFLSEEGLKDAIGLEAEGPNKGLCMDLFFFFFCPTM